MLPPELQRFSDLLDGVFTIREREGPSRVCDLRDAVARHVEPGMCLHTLVTHAIPYGLINEVIRQHWGTDPRFCLATMGAASHAVMMIKGGLLERIITTYCGDVYPTPGPNPTFTEAYIGDRVTIENWSVLSLSLRLLAGGLGLPGLPTRTLLGSSMAEDNTDAYARMTDPFGGHELGWVRALRPDLSLVHGWVADPSGNVLFSPPLCENLWGAMAARHGALVSVEKVVDTSFIRSHAHLPGLPAAFVRAVVELPFGAHPGGFFGRPFSGCQSYAEDYDFIVEFREADRDPERFERWMQRWVLGPKSHQEYLERLGGSHLADLLAKGRPDAWEQELAGLADRIPVDAGPTPNEIMTVEAARRLAGRCRECGYRTILAGQGTSNLAAWLAFMQLRRDGLEVDLAAETGFFGYAPRPGNPFIFNFANLPQCKMLSDSLWTLGGLVGGAGSSCIGSLSAGQIDRRGNVNSTLVPGVYYIVGSGGACDVLCGAAEVIVSLPLKPMRWLERVPYVTGPGERVRTVVSDLAVFEKDPDSGELVLVALVPDGERSFSSRLEEVRGLMGFEPRVVDEPAWVDPPGAEELRTIRLLDPRRSFLE